MGARILLVEDDPGIADLMKDLLEVEGHEVARTASGRAALLMAAEERFDLAIVDINVRDFSGLATERAVRDFADTPVVVMSSDPLDWERDALRGGAIACLRKPFPVEKLVRLVTSSVEGSRDRAEGLGDVAHLRSDDLERIGQMTSQEHDELPFGIIKVDDRGTILEYSAYEARAAELGQDQVVGIGLHELAPCILVKDFLREMNEADRDAPIDEVFRFVFPHHGGLAVVSVRLWHEASDPFRWIFVSKRSLYANLSDATASAARARGEGARGGRGKAPGTTLS